MPTAPNHTALLGRRLDDLRRGDVQARDDIIELACERLRSLARRMLRGSPRLRRWAETDDVLQGAMMRLHRSLAQVTPETPRQFYALAATQVRRELLDLARHHYGPQGGGANHHADCGDAVGVEPDGRAGPGDLETWTAFHEHAGRLPEPEREVFDLIWYEGLAQPDVAAVLGVSLATVKRRWQSARISLFEALRGEPPE